VAGTGPRGGGVQRGGGVGAVYVGSEDAEITGMLLEGAGVDEAAAESSGGVGAAVLAGGGGTTAAAGGG